MTRTRTKLLARSSALPAIVAALALSSTPVWAQEAQPVPTEPPADTTAAQPAPAVPDPAPVAPDASSPADTANAPAAAETTTTKSVRTTKRASAAKSVPVATRTVSRTVVRTPEATTASTETTTATAPVATNARPKPIIDLNAKPALPATSTAAVKPVHKNNDVLPIAGGALAFLAIGGAAVAMTRRRHEEEEWTDETVVQEPLEAAAVPEVRDDPVVHDEQPAIVAPSAFAWERQPQADDPTVRGSDETHIERAYRGPTPENPSLSLRARLKRAAFMDKREREAAAGLAEPVDPTAGLPDRLVEARELA